MDRALELLKPILDDELSSARDAFGKLLMQKVAEFSSTGNRFSSALANALETLAKEELRHRAALILACSTKLSPSSLTSMSLETLLAWAQGQLASERVEIQEAVVGVQMGKATPNTNFLDEVTRSSASRLEAELVRLFNSTRSSEQEVVAEAPDFVRKAKWIVTKGHRNWQWVALGLLLLLGLAVAPRLLPSKIAQGLGLKDAATPTPEGVAAGPDATTPTPEGVAARLDATGVCKEYVEDGRTEYFVIIDNNSVNPAEGVRASLDFWDTPAGTLERILEFDPSAEYALGDKSTNERFLVKLSKPMPIRAHLTIHLADVLRKSANSHPERPKLIVSSDLSGEMEVPWVCE